MSTALDEPPAITNDRNGSRMTAPAESAHMVAASADATDLTTRVSGAPTWSIGLLALCLVIALSVIVPAQHRHQSVPTEGVAR